jgi:tellurite methyltransferase
VHSPLLNEHLGALIDASALGPIVDLACGSGRNGLFLARMGCPSCSRTTRRRRSTAWRTSSTPRACPARRGRWTSRPAPATRWRARRFSAALVFRYLHRPLMPHLRASILPGGLVVYETFTLRNTRYGRPHNPDFLLQPGELAELFAGWTTLHFFEGFLPDPDREVAQLVGRKPFE